MLVKRTIRIVLIHYKDLTSIPTVNVIGKENVYMVTVYTLCTAEVSVSVVHFAFPLLAVSILTSAHTAFGLLNRNVESSNLHMSLFVVACFLLPISRICICGIFGSFDSIVLSFHSSYASSIVHIVLPIFDRNKCEFILLSLQLFGAFRNFASRRVGHVTVWGCWIVGFILCPQSVVSSRLLILLFGGRPYFFFACIKHIRKNVSIKGDTSVRLRRCGLKGISLLYSFSDKHLMHIQAVLVCVLHGTAEHITTLTIVHNRICEIMVNNTTFTAIWHRAKIHRILKAINK